jgi:hypothetical protein
MRSTTAEEVLRGIFLQNTIIKQLVKTLYLLRGFGRAASARSAPRVGLSAPSPSGAPQSHQRCAPRLALRWFRYYPSRIPRASHAGIGDFVASRIMYARIKYLILATRARSAILATSFARGIVAEPPSASRLRRSAKVMERIARRERAEGARSGSPKLIC